MSIVLSLRSKLRGIRPSEIKAIKVIHDVQEGVVILDVGFRPRKVRYKYQFWRRSIARKAGVCSFTGQTYDRGAVLYRSDWPSIASYRVLADVIDGLIEEFNALDGKIMNALRDGEIEADVCTEFGVNSDNVAGIMSPAGFSLIHGEWGLDHSEFGNGMETFISIKEKSLAGE